MKSLSESRRPKDLKRKREDTGDDTPERIDKQLKSSDFHTTSNINLDNNADESAGFFDEYCQILLKDSTQDNQQSLQNVSIDEDLLGEKDREMFNEISPPLERAPLTSRLKAWALKHEESLKHEVIDELLTILRDEGYLDLPGSAGALMGNDKPPSVPPPVEKAPVASLTEGEPDTVHMWIKKEESSESMWANDDNNSSDPLSHDEIEGSLRGDVICPDFAVTDFMSNSKGKEPLESAAKIGLDGQGSKLLVLLKEELQKMEHRWARQLETTKRSLLYDMVGKYEVLKNQIGMFVKPLGTSRMDDKEILRVKLPFIDVDTFVDFDESILGNTEKEIAMKSLMTTLCFGATSLSNSIGSILSAFLTKDVQLQYSACGKSIKGVKKLNFGDTNTFKYAKDVLREKYGTSDAEIVSKTSRWFTGAGDRDGGRKERRKCNSTSMNYFKPRPKPLL